MFSECREVSSSAINKITIMQPPTARTNAKNTGRLRREPEGTTEQKHTHPNSTLTKINATYLRQKLSVGRLPTFDVGYQTAHLFCLLLAQTCFVLELCP